jgi:hypothetical protein
MTKKRTKKKTNKKMPSIGKKKIDLGIKRSEFSNREEHQKGKEMYQELQILVKRLLSLSLVANNTQREELIRMIVFNLNTRDCSKLPCDTDGIGCKKNNVFACLIAELVNAVKAYWLYLEKPTDPNYECYVDGMEYLDQVCRDPDGMCTVDLGMCRYRIANPRIKNGFRMVED